MSLKSQIDELTGQLAEALATIETEREQAAALAAQIPELEAQVQTLRDQHAAELATVTEERDAHLEHTHEQAARIAAIEADLATAQEELTQARQALANPAYADAAIVGGDAVQDADQPNAPAKSYTEQLEAIKDPRERRAFYLAHKNEIKAELRG